MIRSLLKSLGKLWSSTKLHNADNFEAAFKNSVHENPGPTGGKSNFSYPNVPIGKTFLSQRDFIEQFNDKLEAGSVLNEHPGLSIVGRIFSVRVSSKKLYFVDLHRDNVRIQVVVSLMRLKDPAGIKVFGNLKNGDVVEFEGVPGKTNMGELSLFATSGSVLTPCLQNIPYRPGIKSNRIRFRQRHLDLLSNHRIYDLFKKRFEIVDFLRKFLAGRGFTEVETPILSTMAGGAMAEPFKTKLNCLSMDLELRISPELYLKQLAIGGFEKIFEIGKQFRNEDIDPTHNPEFTSCELYQAYSSVPELMKLTEDLFVQAAVLFNDSNMRLSNGTDVSAPFDRIDITTHLEEVLSIKFPPLDDPDFGKKLRKACLDKSMSFPPEICEPKASAIDILDYLVKVHIESKCVRPTFVYGHPLFTSPLAKAETNRPLIADRFELIVNGKELVNAYSELNDPHEQRLRFIAQKQGKTGLNFGRNVELHPAEEAYCKALEYGLPPTCGWGLGVDRFVMLFTNQGNIKEILPFPLVRPLSTEDSSDDEPNIGLTDVAVSLRPRVRVDEEEELF